MAQKQGHTHEAGRQEDVSVFWGHHSMTRMSAPMKLVGKTMRAYVNGVERLAYTDEALPAFGYAGATVSDGTAARFDRFVLKEL